MREKLINEKKEEIELNKKIRELLLKEIERILENPFSTKSYIDDIDILEKRRSEIIDDINILEKQLEK